MKDRKLITEKEFLTLKLFVILTALFTIISISSKFIGGYNSATEGKKVSFLIIDCYSFFPNDPIFIFFLLFTFLFILSIKRFTKIGLLLPITFATLTFTLLQTTYLSVWFAEFANIEWNSTFIRPNIFDSILYFCFAITLLIQLKIIYRFAKERFQDKISLK